MATIPNPILDPLGAPVVSGSEITLDTLSKQPTRVTRMLADISLQNFVSPNILAAAGGVSGGAVLYDFLDENDLYLTRDVQIVSPGSEFPEVTSARLAPKIATVVKWGGKFDVTDEARDRNDTIAFTNHVRKLANTMVRKTDQYVINAVQTAITASNRTTVGHSWGSAIPNGNTPTAPGSTPFGDIADIQTQAQVDELGVVYDTLLMNPQEWNNLLTFSQFNVGNLEAILRSFGITRWFVSNRVTAGSPIFLQGNQAGEFRAEKPLGTESWREASKEKTWFQSSARFVAYVTNPFAMMRLTGVA